MSDPDPLSPRDDPETTSRIVFRILAYEIDAIPGDFSEDETREVAIESAKLRSTAEAYDESFLVKPVS